MFICSLAANRHLETYAQDTGAGMSLIHFLVSFSLLISVISVTFVRPHLTSCRMTLIKRLKETKKCIRDIPAPVSFAYVSRCLLAVMRQRKILLLRFNTSYASYIYMYNFHLIKHHSQIIHT